MEQTNIPAKSVTKEMIAEWKKKHGEIFKIVVDGKTAFLKKPSRKNLSYAAATKDLIKYNEIILNACWLAGDEEIKTDDELFLAVSGKLDGLIEVKEAELEKL